MNLQELDLVILKHLVSSKTNAADFTQGCDEKVLSSDAWRFTKLLLDYVRIYKETPTRKVMCERAQNSEHLVKYLNQMWDDLDKVQIKEAEYKHDLEKLKTRFTERLIYDLKDRLIGEDGRVDLTKSIGDLNATVNHIKGINQAKIYDQKTLKESLNSIRQKYVAKQQDPGYGAGLKTGIKFFDDLTGGLRPSECLIYAGPTAGGKSILLNQNAINLWMGDNTIDTEKDFKPGCDVVYFSLEMPLNDCLERVMANIAKVPQVGIRDATLNEEQKQRMGKALRFIERYPHELIIVDAPRGVTPEGVEAIYNNIIADKGKKPQVIVIDYLALMEYSDPKLDDWLKQGKLAESVVEIGRVHNINIITAVQMTSDDKNKPGSGQMGTHRLSRSRLIGHNANFIMMIEQRANEVQRTDFILHLVKSRRSALATGTLFKNLECCALLNEAILGTVDINSVSDADISDEID